MPIFVHATQHISQKSCACKVFFFICNTSKLSAFHNLKMLYQLVAQVIEKTCRDTFAFILWFHYQHGHLDDSMFALNLHDREGTGSHPSWGYSHRYLQWNILHLLDMARIKSESDERRDETNEETNSSKHNAFNKPNLPRDKELATQPPLNSSIYILWWHTLFSLSTTSKEKQVTYLMQHVK